MRVEKASRAILNRTVWTLLAVFLFYIVGVFVRHAYGARVDITNRTEGNVHDVTLGFVGWNYREEIPVGEIASGETRRLFFRPRMKSSYFLNFTDAQGIRHTEAGETYIPGTDSPDIKMAVQPSGKAEMDFPRHHFISWESWCGFL